LLPSLVPHKGIYDIAEREVIAYRQRQGKPPQPMWGQNDGQAWEETVPATPAAERWAGFGSSLKPAHEPVICARKPLSGTIAQNVLQHGTGARNIDGCRVRTDDALSLHGRAATENGWDPRMSGEQAPGVGVGQHLGRWPANVALTHADACREVGTRKVRGDNRATGDGKRPGGFANVGAETGDGEPNAGVYGDTEVSAWDCVPGCPVASLDAQAGNRPPSFRVARTMDPIGVTWGLGHTDQAPFGHHDDGGPSRYFYCAKASSAERDAGLSGFDGLSKPVGMHSIHSRECNTCGNRTKTSGQPWPACGHEDWQWVEVHTGRHRGDMRNPHSTVKPLSLMKWLVRLVGGQSGSTVLDCFAGSGSTGCAAVQEGFRFIGIERQGPEWVREHPEADDYVSIARARIAWWAGHPEGMKLVERLEQERETAGKRDAGQLDLFGSES
jgi:DNA methylase